MVVGETVGPALVGVIWLGDRTREGLAWLAALGFVVAVAGALALARFGEAPVGDASAPARV
jgi:phosphatidylserine synthase